MNEPMSRKEKMRFRIATILSLILFAALLCCGCDKTTERGKNDPVAASLDLQDLKNRINELLKKVDHLRSQGKYAEALVDVRTLVDLSERFPEKPKFRYDMLDSLHFLLLKTGAYEEAVQAGLALESLSLRTDLRPSPWNCLKIAEAYLGQGQLEKALDWIEKAVDERGFIAMELFENATYSSLRESPRFQDVIARMEKKIGIGLPAKEFSVQLLNGTDFILSEQKGKVVLIDFWDVDCPPCRKGMPFLKKMVRDFGEKGLVLIGISLDTDKAKLNGFLDELSPSWPMACSFKGWADETVRLYGIHSTPSFWLIDRDGILRKMNIRGDDLVAAVRELL